MPAPHKNTYTTCTQKNIQALSGYVILPRAVAQHLRTTCPSTQSRVIRMPGSACAESACCYIGLWQAAWVAGSICLAMLIALHRLAHPALTEAMDGFPTHSPAPSYNTPLLCTHPCIHLGGPEGLKTASHARSPLSALQYTFSQHTPDIPGGWGLAPTG